ncbi:MAG: GNAT family N-acetyltransferase [Acidobacteria bacterium]|nr:GNAT family N-acetyltransferase [Acidobacteriota bacterium]
MAYPLVDHALAIRLERAEGAIGCRFVEARAALVPDLGACWQDIDGAWAIFDGVGSPLTQSFGLGLDVAVRNDTLMAIEAFFAARGVQAEHEVSPLALGDALGVLTAAGYEPFELTSVLYRPVAGGVAAPGDDAPATRAVDADEADAWAEVAADGWSDTPEVVPFVRAVGGVYVRMRSATCYVAEHHGEAAATGVLAIHDGVAVLAGASTRPAFRRRGAQLALLSARLDEASSQGCDLAMMSARPGSASQRNAERHGFRIAYTRIKWRRREP